MLEKEKFSEDTENIKKLAVLPLKNVVLLPRSIIPIIVGRQISIQAVEQALKTNKTIFITTQKNAEVENPQYKDLFSCGTKATILQMMRMPKGTLKILAEGISRAKIKSLEVSPENFLTAEIEELETINIKNTTEASAIWRHLQKLYMDYAQINSKAPVDLINMAQNSKDMDYMADTIAMHINLPFEDRQEFLETLDLKERLLKLCDYLKKEIEIIEMEERIKGRVQDQLEKSQREYYLNEQIKAIQKELGRDDSQGEVDTLKRKIKNLKCPKEVKNKAEREIKRLEQMPPMAAEAIVIRHYLDWIISLPWVKENKDDISITEAEKILNKNHAGLKKIKERITEFLAAKKFSKTLKRTPIICFIGPPGVGKTSLGKSIAESLNRECLRISLGGIKDEAEIRGHRRTYIGALPGKIIQSMRKTKTVNPVILLDEIDKLSSDIHGDPASALLEVLDPEQNKSFTDHFLELEYDLSKVMFIATANHLEGIPYALYDRMEMINFSGYTENEKVDIAKKFLIPKNLKEHSLNKKQFILQESMIRKIIESYTKEAGVRQLERVITKLMRKSIQELLKDKQKKSIIITEKHILNWLGNIKFKKTTLSSNKNKIGLATGLAWTELGGDILEIEAAALPGKGGLTLTGQLGEVMQESAQAALSYIRSKASELKIKKSFYSSKDIHIHVPEGATPKDGPSAGITMCVALTSALTQKPIAPNIAMTGEITLGGRVLSVGGLKEKLLAAKQYGIKKVLIPQENKDDLEEFKNEIGKDIEYVYVNNMDDVIKHTLINKKKPVSKKRKARA